MIKNQTVKLEITDITAEGAGVGRYGGMAIFVPDTAPGDIITAKIVKVKSHYAYGIIESIITPSTDRVNADCSHFKKCGGCVFRHINYEAEVKIKTNRVKETLKRIAGMEINCGGIVGSDNINCYRNKAQFPVCAEFGTGFFAPRSHRVIPIDNCALLPDEFNRIAQCVSEFIKENNISIYDETKGTGLVRHLYIRKGAVTGEIMAVIVINGDSLPRYEVLTERLLSITGENLKSIQININKKHNNVILGDKNICLYGSDYITDILCGVKIRLSPFTFYQINHAMAEKLYKKVKEYAKPEGKSVIDLYCGAGTIGLSLCDTAKRVTGVEIVPEAVSDAKENAKSNGIKNCEFLCGDAKDAALKLAKKNIKADIVIVDPPRKGCEGRLLDTIANDFSPERIVYVSCDPGTLARDLKTLNELGYKPQEYAVFDMFPRTAHVETVVLLSRK